MSDAFSHIVGVLRHYWEADHEVNPYVTIAGGVCLACILIFLSRTFDRFLHVRYLGIYDIINLLVFLAAVFIYPASYAAHHTEMKIQRQFSMNNHEECIFWFIFTFLLAGAYNREFTISLFVQSTILSILLSYGSDITVEYETRFDLWEFFTIWCTLFLGFGLLPILSFQNHILGFLIEFKKFFFRRYKASSIYEYCCYFFFGFTIRVWYEFVLYNSFESVRFGFLLYLGFYLIVPRLFGTPTDNKMVVMPGRV